MRQVLLLVVVLVAGGLVGCKQTRPLPPYEPLLVLEANEPRPVAAVEEMYRPGWAGPAPKPRKGG
jgi:hypothetical protein